jgi:DNA-binding NarL/FixJ family response regulator
MDIEMPTMDGVTATRRIIAADPSAQIIILTNHDHPSLREAARCAGACGYALKENLLAVRELIGERQRQLSSNNQPPGESR